jgi:hypothetical protein
MENAQDQQKIWDEVAAEKGNAPAVRPQIDPSPVVAEPVIAATEEPKAPTTEDQLREALARVEKLEGRTRNVEGHIGGLTRNQNEIRSTLQAAQAAAAVTKDAPTTGQIKEAIADPEKWSALKTDFPEWADATAEYVDARLAQVKAGPDIAAIEKIVAERVKGETDAVRREIIDTSLDAVFPGWKGEVQSDAFKAWIALQPDTTKKLTASDSVGDAARLLKLYESAKQASPTTQILEQRKQKLAAAVTAPKGVRPSAVKSPDDMTPQELWAYEARQREKRKASLA